jgi:hypothetical protein
MYIVPSAASLEFIDIRLLKTPLGGSLLAIIH